jgi:hypothetical protein
LARGGATHDQHYAPIAPPVLPRLLYSSAEAETLLGVSHATLYRLLCDASKGSATKSVVTAGSNDRFIACQL